MDIAEVLKETDKQKQLAEFTKNKKLGSRGQDLVAKWLKQYTGDHDILKRRDKDVGPEGAKKTIKTAKLPITHQKKITLIQETFLVGESVKYNLQNQEITDELKEAHETILEVFQDNKMEYFDRKLVRTVMSETHAAELWHVRDIKNKQDPKVRVTLLAESNKDKIYPYWDETGDLVAVTRQYISIDGQGKKVELATVYMADKELEFSRPQGSSDWVVVEKDNPYGKIRLVYYNILEPVWADVQKLIERDELKTSKLSDVVDYYGDPIIKIYGNPEEPADRENKDKDGNPQNFKNEVGKVIRFAPQVDVNGKVTYGDAKYLIPESYPDLREMENKIIKELIYSLTSTPDISFANIKGIGNISGITIKLLFLDALFKRMENEETFGAGFTRRYNLNAAIQGTINVKKKKTFEELRVKPEFGSPIPSDMNDLAESLSIAVGGKSFMTPKTAARKFPLIDDAEAEIDALEDEVDESLQGDSFNIGDE